MVVIVSRIESTIDYPGKMGQIVFTSGCNFRCKFCHNPELVEVKDKGLNLDNIIRDLKIRADAGWYEGVCISGGEPTLYKDLPEFIKKLKELKLAVKLDTNGTNPEMLKYLLDNHLADYIAMDIKSKKQDYSNIANTNVDIEKIEKSIEIIKKFPEYEFRTTILPFFNEKDIEEIGKWLSKDGKIKRFSIQQFHNQKTLDPSYKELKPKSKEELHKLGKIMEKYADEVKVLDD